jgi:hypothetical protein
MSGRGRRLTILFATVALTLTVGRSASLFLTERLWEASVSEAVAQAGSRRALLGLLLELFGYLIAVGWCVLHLTIAARAALPDRAPPERESARLWPSRYPRWWLTAAGVGLGVVVGSGVGGWLEEILLLQDGVRFGVPEPLLGVDLGFFLRDFPLLIHLQNRVALLATVALAGVILLHIAGGAIRIVKRRVWVSPSVRGHLAVLLAALALALAWGVALEPFRLAAGLRGPMLSSEFLLRTLVAEVEAGLGAAAAVASFLWWLRVRGFAAVVAWSLFGVSLLAGRVLPLQTEKAVRDDGWRIGARRLDSIAFGLGEVVGTPLVIRTPAAALHPTLWDPIMLGGSAADSTRTRLLGRGWITAGGHARPVWYALREGLRPGPELVAVSDDQVALSGGPLSWREGDSVPSPGWWAHRELTSHSIRPGAPMVDADSTMRGVLLDSWPKRLVLGWALQRRAAFSAPEGTRLGWRLDPVSRLRGAAPFAYWTAPRVHLVSGGLYWISDGLLASAQFPSSARIAWNAGVVSMVRPAFLGVVDAASGSLRIFRRDPADSLSAAWARIAAPLIESPELIPPGLLEGDGYPEELLLAQAGALAGAAWGGGRLDRGQAGAGGLPPMAPGGTEALVPFGNGSTREVSAFLRVRRTVTGDSLHLIGLDTPNSIESESTLLERWKRLPFHGAISDSVKAAGSRFEPGLVRHAIAEEGLVAYQPAWGVAPSGRAQLVLVSVAVGGRLGIGRRFEDAWRNFRAEISPVSVGSGADEVLEAARGWMRHADSALKRGDLQELGRALEFLKDLLERPRRPR